MDAASVRGRFPSNFDHLRAMESKCSTLARGVCCSSWLPVKNVIRRVSLSVRLLMPFAMHRTRITMVISQYCEKQMKQSSLFVILISFLTLCKKKSNCKIISLN